MNSDPESPPVRMTCCRVPSALVNRAKWTWEEITTVQNHLSPNLKNNEKARGAAYHGAFFIVRHATNRRDDRTNHPGGRFERLSDVGASHRNFD